MIIEVRGIGPSRSDILDGDGVTVLVVGHSIAIVVLGVRHHKVSVKRGLAQILLATA